MTWERTPQRPPPMGLTELRSGIREGTLVLRPDGRVEWPGRGIVAAEQLTPEARTWLAKYVAHRKHPRR